MNGPLIAYGHNAEDVVLCHAFVDRPQGFFVDVGAGEPDSGSLTTNLVDLLGWRGVNLEPLPDRALRLRRARPRDVNLQVAVGAEPGSAVLHRIVPTARQPVGGAGLSTLDPEVAERHRAAGWGVEVSRVPVVTLESVLAEHAEPGFDLLKVDVEGWEAQVLASADLAWWRPRALVVEATVPKTRISSHQAWEPGVLAAGYVLAQFDGVNRFYARHDEPLLLERLAVSAGEYSGWVPWTDTGSGSGQPG